MDIAGWVQDYGLLAVGLGTFLEGESVLLIAGAAAAHGHLSLPAVIVVATFASFLGDQLFFQIGRRHGERLLARLPALRPRAERVRALLERHHLPLILSIRFLYGLRIAGPMAIGMSRVPWPRFFLLNLAGAAAWAALVTGLGYGAGQALGRLMKVLEADAGWGLVLLGAMLVAAWLAIRLRRSRR